MKPQAHCRSAASDEPAERPEHTAQQSQQAARPAQAARPTQSDVQYTQPSRHSQMPQQDMSQRYQQTRTAHEHWHRVLSSRHSRMRLMHSRQDRRRHILRSAAASTSGRSSVISLTIRINKIYKSAMLYMK